MGCSIDHFNADFRTKEAAIKFINIFNNELKEDVDVSFVLEEENIQFRFGQYSLDLEGEPWFLQVNRGVQIAPIVERFLKENPDETFYGFYSCAFTNCGDTTYIEYTYNNGILTIDTRWGELPYETYCEECGYDAEEDFDEDSENEDAGYIVKLETWEEGTVYKCPECGAEIEFEATHEIVNIAIK